ncbi:MAG: LamG domain-containing protein [Kiritimatiellaeota bacterium]|nr:LamG domain-containing protein [Kiritimatiellota bacterium]
MKGLMIALSAAALAGTAAAGTVEVGTLRTDTAQIGKITPLPSAKRLELNLSFATDMGGEVYDTSGNRYKGTVFNCAWTNEGRFVGGAMSWGGANAWESRVTVGTVPDFTMWDAYSVSVWFKYAAEGQYNICTLFDTALGGHEDGLSVAVYYDYLYVFLISQSAYTDLWIPYTNYLDGQWHHLVFVRDGAEGQLWTDGTLKGTMDGMFPVSLGTSPFCVGNISNYQSPYSPLNWIGLIDEVRIYNCALGAEEIQRLYEDGLLILPPLGTSVAASGDLTVGGGLTVTGAVNFLGGARWLQPSGDLKQGSFTSTP